MNIQAAQNQNIEEEAKQVEILVESMCKPSSNNNFKEINTLLTKFFEDFEKINLMKFLLYYSNSLYTKMYSSNAIFNLITKHFLSVELTFKLEIYEFLINFIVKFTNFRKVNLMIYSQIRNFFLIR